MTTLFYYHIYYVLRGSKLFTRLLQFYSFSCFMNLCCSIIN